VWSRFLLSLSLWGIVIVALIEIPKLKNTQNTVFQWLIEYLQFWHWKLPPQYKTHFKEKKALIALTIPFFIVVLSGLWSENLSYWLSRVQLRLPFLLLPLAFSMIPPLSKKQLQTLLFLFLVVISVNCLVVLTNYVFNFDIITKNLGQGKAMPFLKEHITFSIMTAFAFFIGIELWQDVPFMAKKGLKTVVPVLTIFLFIAIHIIAVRTGIIALYLGLILRGILFIFQSRRYLVGVLGFALLFAIPLLSYQFLPSFQQRINYAIWDLEQYKAGDPDTKSDSERIVSLKIGLQIFSENKLLGVGFGDIEQEMNRIYEQKYPTLDHKLPHNQWLLTLMGTGIVGFVVSLFVFWYPVFEQKRFKDFLFLSLHIFVFVFSMTDIPFEASFSLSFYVFFVCLFLNNRSFINYENV
jgi:O-antigen ligase